MWRMTGHVFFLAVECCCCLVMCWVLPKNVTQKNAKEQEEKAKKKTKITLCLHTRHYGQ